MRDEPNLGLGCLATCLYDTIHGVVSFEQLDGGHGS